MWPTVVNAEAMTCTCHICGKQYKVDFMVIDDLWEKIRPDKSRPVEAGLMCGMCITQAVEDLDEYDAYELIRI
jgi:hypothetical protein